MLEELNAAQVPAYHWNAWYDIFVLDAILYWANYEGPQRLGIGAWSHGAMPDSALMADRARLTTIEQLRWFDYWLKGIDNGIMDESPVHYAVMNDPGDWTWESSDTWPIPGTEDARFYFGEGPSEQRRVRQRRDSLGRAAGRRRALRCLPSGPDHDYRHHDAVGQRGRRSALDDLRRPRAQ